MIFPLVLWPSLYDVSRPEPLEKTWPELVTLLTAPARPVPTKDASPGFGPYALKPGGSRRDADVLSLSLAVFDADEGDPRPAVDALSAVGIAQIWYPTFSHRPEKPSYRLIIPLATPVAPENWPGVRAFILDHFPIPANRAKCSGASHFYYLPSYPAGAEPPEPAFEIPGRPLFPPTVVPAARALAAAAAFEPPPEPDEPIDLGPLRAKLARRATALEKRGAAAGLVKARLLRALLAGQELAPAGGRNDATARAAALVVWTLPAETPLSALLEIMKPSVAEQLAAGSKTGWSDVDRMLRSAAAKRAEADRAEAEFKEALVKLAEEYRK